MRVPLACGIVAFCLLAPGPATGQQPGQAPQDTSAQARDSVLVNGVSAGEAEAEPPRRRLVKWNEYEGPFMTFRLGGDVLLDYAAYSQDAASKGQVEVSSGFKVRDSRLVLGGRIKTKRRITYQAGFMYDGYTDEWFVRQTGLMVAIPELWGHLWIGRSKEGPSLNRVMVGYDGWTIERFTFSDVAIPLLADGVKWLGYVPSRHLIWNLGVFTDWLSEKQSFSYYDYQVAGRVAWAPMVSDSAGKLLHLGASFQVGKPDDGFLQLKSKPEATTAPNFIDTGKFPASSATLLGVEAYYRPGPWLFGTEYYLEKASSAEAGNPLFHGGDVAVTWLATGETRSYNTVGGYFRGVSPRRTIFEGGPGAVELTLRFSYSDLNGGALRGGTFWRITPMVNWYLSDNFRLALVYGYGRLDRFGVKGNTQFFQTRLQLVL
jgi:phosphate-selective porin OprO/OprP